jgi:hypothetical protein
VVEGEVEGQDEDEEPFADGSSAARKDEGEESER